MEFYTVQSMQPWPPTASTARESYIKLSTWHQSWWHYGYMLYCKLCEGICEFQSLFFFIVSRFLVIKTMHLIASGAQREAHSSGKFQIYWMKVVVTAFQSNGLCRLFCNDLTDNHFACVGYLLHQWESVRETLRLTCKFRAEGHWNTVHWNTEGCIYEWPRSTNHSNISQNNSHNISDTQREKNSSALNVWPSTFHCTFIFTCF